MNSVSVRPWVYLVSSSWVCSPGYGNPGIDGFSEVEAVRTLVWLRRPDKRTTDSVVESWMDSKVLGRKEIRRRDQWYFLGPIVAIVSECKRNGCSGGLGGERLAMARRRRC